MGTGSTSIEQSTSGIGTTTPPPSSDVVNNAPIYFPPIDNDEFCADKYQVTFEESCQLAAESHRPLILLQSITNLTQTIVLRRRQHLSIVGRLPATTSVLSSCKNSECNHSLTSERIQIAGEVHSLFLLNNHSELKLQDLELIHQDDNGEDCRKVGAAVNLRYKSKARLEDCFVTSHAGFCCWAVQKAQIEIERCYLEAPLRSAVVCFGQARFEGRSSTIANVGVHGVCARGECHIRLFDSSILNSAVRGLYAYANASVCLDGCTIRGTVRPDMAAIEVSSADIVTTSFSCTDREKHNKDNIKSKSHKKIAAIQKASSLIMNGCHVVDNAGVGLRIRGGVRHNLSSKNQKQNYFDRNLGGNKVDYTSADVDEAPNQKRDGDKTDMNNQKQFGNIQPKGIEYNKHDMSHLENNLSNFNLQRDPSGSSFRKGDWWCMGCIPKIIVQGSKDSCPRCTHGKRDGQFLSSEEVIRLNRSGQWILSTAATNIDALNTTTNIVERDVTKDNNGRNVLPQHISATWWFDGDDAGWLPYDTESNQKLESVFQLLSCLKETLASAAGKEKMTQELCKRISSTKVVSLSEGRYNVDLETMQQINTSSHFLRLVRRREK